MDIQKFLDKRYDGNGMDSLADFAEMVRFLHYAVATSNNPSINYGWGILYQSSQKLFKSAIQAAYPNLDEEEIYYVWSDCMESVEYCANLVKQRIIDEMQERAETREQ